MCESNEGKTLKFKSLQEYFVAELNPKDQHEIDEFLDLPMKQVFEISDHLMNRETNESFMLDQKESDDEMPERVKNMVFQYFKDREYSVKNGRIYGCYVANKGNQKVEITTDVHLGVMPQVYVTTHVSKS